MATLTEMMADPGFAALDETSKAQVLDHTLSTNKSFTALAPADQAAAKSAIYMKAGLKMPSIPSAAPKAPAAPTAPESTVGGVAKSIGKSALEAVPGGRLAEAGVGHMWNQPAQEFAQDSVGNVTKHLADAATTHLGPMIGKGVEKILPHSDFDAALMGLTALIPGGAEVGAEVRPEIAAGEGILKQGIRALTAPGLKGMGARAALSGVGGAAAGELTGEATPVSGATQGVVQSAIGELPGMVGRRQSYATVADVAKTAAARETAADVGTMAAAESGLGMTKAAAEKEAGTTVIPTPPKPLTDEEIASKPVPYRLGVGSFRTHEMAVRHSPVGLTPVEHVTSEEFAQRVRSAMPQEEADQYLQGARDAVARHKPMPTATAGVLSDAKRPYIEQRESMRKAVGVQYDPIFQPVNERPLSEPEAQLASEAAADAIDEVATQRGKKLSAAPAKLLHEVQGWYQVDEKGKVTVPKNTVATVRGTFQRLLAEADKPANSPTDRSALLKTAGHIQQWLDDQIGEDKKPALLKINSEYAKISKMYPFKDIRLIGSAANMNELGEMLYERIPTDRTMMAIARMEEPEKQLMRDAFATNALAAKRTPAELAAFLKDKQNMLEQLGFPPTLSHITDWADAARRSQSFMKYPSDAESNAFVSAYKNRMLTAGYDQKSIASVDEALRKAANAPPNRAVRYMTTFGALGAVLNYGPFGHHPSLIIPGVMYMAGSAGLKAMLKNPEWLPVWRDFITSGWTRASGDALGRLTVGLLGDAARTTPALAPRLPEVKTPVPATKAEGVSMKAVGTTDLRAMSKAPISVAMQAYDKALNEDTDPKTAASIRSIITAKSRGEDLTKLTPVERIKLANILKEAPKLDGLSDERTMARGTV